MVLHALHLCSGYGGFELALRLAGVPARTVAHVERDAYAAAALVARMEETHLDQAPIWSDLTTFDGAAWRGRVDLITAGFPCQPWSAAGQQRGVDDERWLWPAIGRIIRDVGPRLVLLENVPGLVRGGLPHVLSDLADLGFDAEWGLFSAAEAGAPHKRERFWLLAHAHGSRVVDDGDRQRDDHSPASRRHVGHSSSSGRSEVPGGTPCDEATGAGPHPGCCGHVADGTGEGVADTQWPPGRDDHNGWAEWIAQGGPEPAVCRSADGRTGRMVRPDNLSDRLHLLGNGLVPAVAAAAFLELARRLNLDPDTF